MGAYRGFPAAVALAIILVLAGCDGAAPERGGADVPTRDSAGSVAVDQPDEDVPPATAPPGSVMPGPASAESLAHWDGFGDARFGMDGEQVALVWPGELNGSAAEGSSCYHLNPVGESGMSHFAMMFEDGPFVRYSVGNDDITAPGGGKRGMDMAQIDGLYPGQVEQSPHKYVPDGHILRIEHDGGKQVLVFETDPEGVVTEWRVGVPPQVDYVEGCG